MADEERGADRRALLGRIVSFAVFVVLLTLSIVSGDPLRITLSAVGLAITGFTVLLWLARWASRHRASESDDRS